MFLHSACLTTVVLWLALPLLHSQEMGAFGMQTPEEFGGIGLNNSSYARLVEVRGLSRIVLHEGRAVCCITGLYQARGICVLGVVTRRVTRGVNICVRNGVRATP